MPKNIRNPRSSEDWIELAAVIVAVIGLGYFGVMLALLLVNYLASFSVCCR